MKLGQKICPDNILDEFKNDAGWLENMAARGRGSFPYMATGFLKRPDRRSCPANFFTVRQSF
jgi:hypothetical protein